MLSRAQRWRYGDGAWGWRVRGSHAVIVGFGRIGEWIGRVLSPLGVRVTGIRRHPERGQRPPWMRAEDVLLPASRLDAVLPDADHVILVLPSGAATDGLFGVSRLALLPPRAVLYNVGRGNAVDETALIDALRQDRISQELVVVMLCVQFIPAVAGCGVAKGRVPFGQVGEIRATTDSLGRDSFRHQE